MSVLDLLINENKWQEFLEYKIKQSNMAKLDEDFLRDFILQKKFLGLCEKILKEEYEFSVPKKMLLNKSGTNKKRVVYTYTNEENIILKFVSFCLFKYDDTMSENCFSFRRNHSVKSAFQYIVSNRDIDKMYGYKVDISNYFNTVDIQKLLPILEETLKDEKLYRFIKKLLTTDKSVFNGEVICEKRGIMAGTSLSTFLANIYLTDLDKYFYENKIIYARYSDDIIVFAESFEKLNIYKQHIVDKLFEKGLVINTSKEYVFNPHEAWDFLGFEYYDKMIDLSSVTLRKIKGKIRRKARALYRWRIRKEKDTEHTIKVMLRVFNAKFYKSVHTFNLTWCKWFFPVITTTRSLEIIDDYLVQYLRYLSTGKHSKRNYNIKYEKLKELGFRSLVNEFYKFKKSREK